MTYQEMQERRAAASAENAALLAYEQGEDPKVLDKEEEALSDKLEAEIETLGTGIKKFEDAEERAQRQRAREATLGATRTMQSTTLSTPDTQVDTLEAEKPPVRIARMRTYGKLKAFNSPDLTADQNAANAFLSGQFLLATVSNNLAAQKWCESHNVALLSPQEEGSNQMGGFLVPPEFGTAIIDLRETYGVARREMKIEPMASNTKTVPRVVSGLTGYYVDENSATTESNKTWDNVRLVAKKIGALAKYSTELDEDAIISMSDDLAVEIGKTFALMEDNELFLGDGTSTYGGTSGLITEGAAATASVHTPVAANSSFGTLDLLDFETMIGKLPQYAETGAKWFISKAGWAASMLRLIDAAGGNTGAMIAGAAPKEFLGYPVVISQVMNSVLTTQTSVYGVCYLGDLRLAATFGNRRDITIKMSDQRYFENDQIGILGTERFAINVHDMGSTSVVGPMITLRMATT